MSIYAISDLHLALCDIDKDMSIYEGWQDYHNRIKSNWTKLIKKDDTVVVVGDISWAMKLDEAKEDLKFLNSLPGSKLIIKGNHDLWWATKSKLEKFFLENNFNTIKIIYNSAVKVEGVSICGTRGWLYDYEEKPDEKIVRREALRLGRSIYEAKQLGGIPIVFMHYPPVYAEFRSSGILDVLIKNDVRECYVGHIHGSGAARAVRTEYKGIKFYLVSADHLGFIPKLVRR